jgi:crossover junction endodeoxyribonuclease RuvC
MVILGIDPGTNIVGYAILVANKGDLRVLDYGIKRIKSTEQAAEKLAEIHYWVSELIRLYRPDELAIESPFYGKNVQSMLKLGRAQGVAMAAAFEAGLKVEEYAPKTIKLSITGKGTASKEQVLGMLRHLLKVNIEAESLDASDALACAVCHANNRRNPLLAKGKKSDWSGFIKDNPNRILGK